MTFLDRPYVLALSTSFHAILPDFYLEIIDKFVNYNCYHLATLYYRVQSTGEPGYKGLVPLVPTSTVPLVPLVLLLYNNTKN